MLQQVSLKIMTERGGMMAFNKLFGKFKKSEVEDEEEIKVQDYLDMIAPFNNTFLYRIFYLWKQLQKCLGITRVSNLYR